MLVGLRIKAPDQNYGITVKWQWSLDGKTWKTGSTLIVEKSTADDYTGLLAAASELTPFGRVIAEIRDTTGATQVAAQISSWTLYSYI